MLHSPSPAVRVPRVARSKPSFHLLAVAAVLVLVACSDQEGPTAADEDLTAAASMMASSGPGHLNVTVRKSDGSLAPGAIVTVVHPTLGPVAISTAGFNGVASFSGLPAADVCVHARADLTQQAAQQTLFPVANAAAYDLVVQRTNQAAVITVRNTSAALTPGNYGSCLARPPVRINSNNNATTLTLTLRQGAALDVTLLGLNGETLGSGQVHAGIVTPFGQCSDYPWLADSPTCSEADIILPGFLHSVNVTGSPAQLTVPPGDDYVIEALQLVAGQGLLTFTKKNNARLGGGTANAQTLQLEPVLCEVDWVPELIGDGNGMDFGRSLHGSPMNGKVKHGIQALYPSLAPDPTAVAVWWEQTGTGSVSFNTRTRVDGLPTLSTSVDFIVNADGTCSAVAYSTTPGSNSIKASVFCAPQGGGVTRVTVRHTDLDPSWTGHEFSIRGGGDAVPDASRNTASSAFVPVIRKSTCSPQQTNDDRWAILL